MDLKDLYQEIILDHGKNPRNLGKFDNYNKDAKGNNPLCGDNVHVYLRLNENKKVEDIAFEGHGCVELTEYEKILGTDFIITNPIDHFHAFFEDFGLPFQPYTEYHFSDKLQFESKQIYQ